MHAIYLLNRAMPCAPAFLRQPVNGARLRQLRSDGGLSQQVLATRAGLCIRTVILAEAQGMASRRTLDAIAGVLRVPPQSLVLQAPASTQPLPPQAQGVPR